MTPDLSDPVDLAARLIGEPSVSPDPGGAQDALAAMLQALGFSVTSLAFGEGAERTPNLFARLGTGAPHLCFAGHTDVVPPGQIAWTHGPYAAEIADGRLYGRGACDMKGGIAAFIAAVSRFLARHPGQHGSISLLITGDEEGPATFGTRKVLEWMQENGQVPDFCVVGEPTNPERMGEVIKIGRRGSISARIIVEGKQGHVAYPHLADNPVHRLTAILSALLEEPLDQGTEWFQPSGLQITSVDVGNPAGNVVPAQAEARLNIRFNDLHSGASLRGWIETIVKRHAPTAKMTFAISGESFLTKPEGAGIVALAEAVAEVTGVEPRLDTGGGTSDARFITNYCPVAEFGLVGASMHQVDEHVALADLETLAQVYEGLLERMLA